MHIPDGMLNPGTLGVCWAASASTFAYASAWVRKNLDSSKVVIMAVLASLIFALQMLNFPIAAGTSGHFGGGVLAAIILGPLPASLVMTAVLLIQSLIFGDGGIVALGANILNMGIVAPFVGWVIYRGSRKISDKRNLFPLYAGIAAWFGVVLSASGVAIELWASNTANFMVALSAMVFWHALIGIGEGIITAGIVAYVIKVRPSVIYGLEDVCNNNQRQDNRGVAIILGVLAIIAASFSFLASKSPDGLEYVFFDQLGHDEGSVIGTYVNAPIADYSIAGVNNTTLAGILAGIAGVIIVGVIFYALIRALTSGRDKSEK